MGLTVSFVLFYCIAKWTTYSFLMYKVYIASRADQKSIKTKKLFLTIVAILLAVTCIAIVSVSRGYIFSESGFCIWKLDGLWIASAYPVGDFLLSVYLMWAFVQPLKASTRDSNNPLLKRVIKENLTVGSICVISSFVMHLAVGIGVVQPRLRIQLVTESLLCIDLWINSFGLFYSTRKSWIRNLPAGIQFDSSAESANTSPAMNKKSIVFMSPSKGASKEETKQDVESEAI
jgi:hypothetical protein